MTKLGYILYEYKLSKSPYGAGKVIPYEDVSKMFLWKLQNQALYMDATLTGIIKKWLKWKWYILKTYPHNFLMKHSFYLGDDGEVYSKMTDHKYFYVHDHAGTYSHSGQPCVPNCKYCIKQVMTYTVNHPEIVQKGLKHVQKSD